MARIRTIKPKFWTDGVMVRLSPLARLLYIGMWNFAECDSGHVDGDSLALKLQILPADECDIDALISELVKAGRIVRIELDGKAYLHVKRLADHQKVDPRWSPRCPVCLAGAHLDSPRLSETPQDSPDLTPVKERKGKERKGEEKEDTPPTPSRFDEFWDLYPRKQAKGDARKAWDAAAKREDQDVIIDGLRRLLPWFESQCKATGDYRPTAGPWLRQERWTDELTPERAPAGRAQQANEAVYATWDRQIEERRQAGLEPPLEITA